MKKQTKLLLGAGAIGLGYLLLRKQSPLAGLGASAADFTADELIEFAEFDKFYYTEWGARKDYGDVLARIAARRGSTLTEAQQDAAYATAVAAGMYPQGLNTAGAADKAAAIVAYYAPFLFQSLADLGLASGGGASEACPAGTEATGQNPDGSLVCTATGGSSGGSSGGSTGAGGGGSTGTTGGSTGTGATGNTGDVLAPPAAKEEGGLGLGTLLLVAGAGAAVFFLLKKDDTKVVRLRGMSGSSEKEYRERFDRAAGVNGLRRRRKARR